MGTVVGSNKPPVCLQPTT